jgi:hypothetical protein
MRKAHFTEEQMLAIREADRDPDRPSRSGSRAESRHLS